MKKVLLILGLSLCSCTSIHYISRESLVSQITGSADTVFMAGHHNGIIQCKIHYHEPLACKGCDTESYFKESELDHDLLNKINDSKNAQVYWFSMAQMKHITCKNKVDEDVVIGVDHNSQLIFIDSLNRKTKMYFQPTVYYDSLFLGFRSVVIHWRNKFDYNNVKQIQIYSEFKKEHKL